MLMGIDILPEPGALTCNGFPQTFPAKITSVDVVAMTCSRKPVQQMVDGIAVTSAPEGTLILRVPEAAFPITLAGYSSSILDKVRREIEDVRSTTKSDILAVQQSLAQWHGDTVPGTHVNINGGYGPITSTCPAGSYAVGLTTWGNSAGGICIGCYVAHQVLCRKLQ